MLEESYGDWEKDSIAASDDEDGEVKKNSTKAKKNRKRKNHGLQRKVYDYDLATSGYVGETLEISCFNSSILTR